MANIVITYVNGNRNIVHLNDTLIDAIIKSFFSEEKILTIKQPDVDLYMNKENICEMKVNYV